MIKGIQKAYVGSTPLSAVYHGITKVYNSVDTWDFTVLVDTDGDTIGFAAEDPDFVINWGDGSNENVNVISNEHVITHTYATAGIHTVTIAGNCKWFSFHGRAFFGTDGCTNSIVDIIKPIPATFGLTSAENMFRDCTQTNISFTASDFMDYIIPNISSINSMFRGAWNLVPTVENWDVSNITDMSYAFREGDLTGQNLNSWNVSNVTTMESMFDNTWGFNSPLSNWNVSSVTNMFRMFNGCSEFNQDISSWDVSNVTNMGWMFGFADLFNQDLSGWNVSNITNYHNFDRDANNWLEIYKPNFPVDYNNQLNAEDKVMDWVNANIDKFAYSDYSPFTITGHSGQYNYLDFWWIQVNNTTNWDSEAWFKIYKDDGRMERSILVGDNINGKTITHFIEPFIADNMTASEIVRDNSEVPNSITSMVFDGTWMLLAGDPMDQHGLYVYDSSTSTVTYEIAELTLPPLHFTGDIVHVNKNSIYSRVFIKED